MTELQNSHLQFCGKANSFVIEINDLNVKFQLCKSFIVYELIKLDPLARIQWLYTYKGIIQYADSHGS